MTWNGNTYTSSGVYTYNNGVCEDSLFLTINSSYESTSSQTACDSYTWDVNNTSYTQSGMYYENLYTTNGCDSILGLDLVINESVTGDILQVSSCNNYQWQGETYSESGIYTDTIQTSAGCDSLLILELTISPNSVGPLKLELVLDHYCGETSWSIGDELGNIIYSGGPYDCEPNGGGEQANDTLKMNINLTAGQCYNFSIYDDYGDGLGGSTWGFTDGSWKLKDYNSYILSSGTGDFGFHYSFDFNVDIVIPTDIEENKVTNSIMVFPNPFSDFTNISITGANGPYKLSLFDLYGKAIWIEKDQNESNFTIYNSNLSNGIYWLKVQSHPEISPVKIVINK
tara:strand:- start:46 stop:1068 length:1023 start_codon:yes stop_codon:yes gene_type:complete